MAAIEQLESQELFFVDTNPAKIRTKIRKAITQSELLSENNTESNIPDEIENENSQEKQQTGNKRKRKSKSEKQREKDIRDEKILSNFLFFNDDQISEETEVAKTIEKSSRLEARGIPPVWIDEDDNFPDSDKQGILYNSKVERLRENFVNVSGQRPKWVSKYLRQKNDASHSSDSERDELDEILSKKTKLTQRSSILSQNIISLTQLKDVNQHHKSDVAMRSVEFHPSSQLVLTAGFHKTLDIFQVDGRLSTRIQGVHIENFPIHSAHFAPNGEEIITTSNKRHFFHYDLKEDKIQQIHYIRGHQKEFFSKFVYSPNNDVIAFLGPNGYIVLVSAKSKQWISDLKMNGNVRSIAFNRTGDLMLSGGSDGEIYVWDMNTRDCVNKFRDEGAHIVNSLTISHEDHPSIACGSDSGIVNIYDDNCLKTSRIPKPVKTYKNLTTSISNLAFNSRNEILAFSSHRNSQALRLAHIGSHTVYANWPTQTSNLGYVCAMDFSYNSCYLAIGNDVGRVLLYRVNHYIDKL